MKALFFVFSTFILLSCSNSDKTAYIDINKVYSEIKITKIYEQKLSVVQENFALKIKTQRAENQKEKDVILAKKNPTQKELEVIFKLQTKLDSLEDFYSKAFNDTSRLYNLTIEQTVNDLVYEYGAKHKYSYIYSPASANTFMYADSTLDISDEIITYINKSLK